MQYKRSKELMALITAVACCASMLAGCSSKPADGETSSPDNDDDVKAAEMNALNALTFEEIAAGRAESADYIENTVYRYVTDTVTIDTSNLVSVTEDEAKELSDVVGEINKALATGTSDVVDESILNYMLWEFANTSYKWEYSSHAIKGIDAATRLYFVDITYKTTDEEKEIIPDSLIVRGAPNEESLKAKRYSDYIVWLQAQDYLGEEQNAWSDLIQSEWREANALSVFAYGLQYENVLNGYTEDAKSKNKELNKDNIDEAYGGDVYVNANGELVSASDYTFEDRWGSIDDIFATQSGVTMVDRLKDSLTYSSDAEQENSEDTEDTDYTEDADYTDDTLVDRYDEQSGYGPTNSDLIGVYTYPGLTEVAHDYGAEMTFRFVFKYAYSIGTDNTMSVQSAYLYNYKLNDYNSLIDAYTTETVQNGDVLTPFIKNNIKSYRKAIEESNHRGLYDLFVTYDKYDTYVADLLEYCYVSNGGFTFDLIGRKGDEVVAVVTQQTKKRAKGTYMSMPTYQEKVLIKVKLCNDDKVRIVSLTTLDSYLIGEPMSIIRNVNGVSEKIAYDSTTFSAANAKAVEEAIAKFEQVQLTYDGVDLKTTDFDVIDLGMSSTEKESVLNSFKYINSFGAEQCGVWLVSYATKSNVYCSVNVREVFVGTDNNLDTEAVIGLLNRNGVWKVISYTRNMSVKTKSQPLDGITSKALATIDITKSEPVTYINTTETKNESGNTNINLNTDDNGGWEIEQTKPETEGTDTNSEDGNINNPENLESSNSPNYTETDNKSDDEPVNDTGLGDDLDSFFD